TSHFRASIPLAFAQTRVEAVERFDRRLVDRLLDNVRRFTPVRTGRLLAGNKRTPVEQTGPAHWSAEGYNDVRYSVDVEFGRHPHSQRKTAEGGGMRPQPFFRDGITVTQAEWDLGA